jgi:hypothetical protein
MRGRMADWDLLEPGGAAARVRTLGGVESVEVC